MPGVLFDVTQGTLMGERDGRYRRGGRERREGGGRMRSVHW